MSTPPKRQKALTEKLAQVFSFSKGFFVLPKRFARRKVFFFTINSENKISTFKITKNRFTFLITFNFFYTILSQFFSSFLCVKAFFLFFLSEKYFYKKYYVCVRVGKLCNKHCFILLFLICLEGDRNCLSRLDYATINPLHWL